jgi:RNA polymerase sigma-70 factor, ECF subfamily
MEESDASAIALAKAGHSDGFRLLVERHSRSVFRLAYRMTGNEFDAEDVVQETFLRAHRMIDHYESRSAFSTWLYRIASNYALDLLRARKRTESRHVTASAQSDEEVTILDLVAAPDPAQDRVYHNKQLQAKLTEAMAELSEQERTAFVLRHYEGLSIEEIGQALNTGPSATKNSIFRAVRKLREALEPLMA